MEATPVWAAMALLWIITAPSRRRATFSFYLVKAVVVLNRVPLKSMLFALWRLSSAIQTNTNPFVSMELHLGPVRPAMRGLNPSPTGQLGYNPRCLSRDLSSLIFNKFFTLPNLANITIGAASHNINNLQTELQGRFSDAFLGLHTAGHTGIAGEATDVFSSPNEPTFWLHHAIVNRVFEI